MNKAPTAQFGRKFSLLVVKGNKALDLSNMHVRFKTSQADFESPNNAYFRIYNLSDQTITAVREFDEVVLQAGYEGNFGVVFKGTIKQFGRGRENSTDTYLDLFAADGDEGYNNATINTTLPPGSTVTDQLNKASESTAGYGLILGYKPGDPGVVLPRGKVLFGMARSVFRNGALNMGASWSIQNGKVQIIPLDSYLPGEAVVINYASGLVGQAEQKQDGVEFKHLLNPRFQVGAACKINNASINQIMQNSRVQPGQAPIPYNQRTGIQELGKIATDGLYRMLVVEHEGDTRGQSWYSYVTALAIDPTSNKVKAYG